MLVEVEISLIVGVPGGIRVQLSWRRCPVSSFQTSLQMNFCITGSHSTVHTYPYHMVQAEICKARLLVDDLYQLQHSRVSALSYKSSETKPLLENCARTTVTSSREGLLALIATFENL
ncbi:hypothetical protein TNCV_4873161 [Trichonephila clavipes]|nr:hypothetical protein TNCV_4873161 [Trichonephila clavipes]